jgi:RimJ/RimL family protein N-acetyltransferase
MQKNHLGLTHIVSVAFSINQSSIRVIEKIGIKSVTHFYHPKLSKFPNLRQCYLYSIELGLEE